MDFLVKIHTQGAMPPELVNKNFLEVVVSGSSGSEIKIIVENLSRVGVWSLDDTMFIPAKLIHYITVKKIKVGKIKIE